MPTYGFDGTVDEVAMAKLARFAGADYAVGGPGDWKVSPVAGSDRTVSIAAGTGYGHFVLDEGTLAETRQLDAIGSGSRWDLICRRRNWQPPGGTSAFEKVTGVASSTPAQVLPAGRLSGPGVADDQPVALVEVIAGQTAVGRILDLRSWPAKVVGADSLLALPDARLGDEAVVAGIRYRRQLTSGGTPGWVTWPPVVQKAVTGTPGADWGLHSFTLGQRDGNRRDLYLYLRKTGVNLTAGAQGQRADLTLFTLDDEWRPPGDMVVPIQYTGSAVTVGTTGSPAPTYDFFTANALLYKNGALTLSNLVPGTQLNARAANDTSYTLKATISFSKGS